MVRILSRRFDIVDVVTDTSSALERLDADLVDLVVTDLDLGPGRPDGLDLATAIAGRGRSTPVILVSGSLTHRVLELAKLAGVCAALAKPVSPPVLFAAIRAALAGGVDDGGGCDGSGY